MSNCKRCGTELPVNKVGDYCGSPSPCGILNSLLVQELAQEDVEVVSQKPTMTEEELLRSIEEHNDAI